MRRAILILLMWLVPFQAVWAAAHTLHGHIEPATAHGHGHDHELDHQDADPAGSDLASHGDGCHHGNQGNHGHAVFTCMVAEIAHGPADLLAAQPPPALTETFTSHIPLLPDPPPAVRI